MKTEKCILCVLLLCANIFVCSCFDPPRNNITDYTNPEQINLPPKGIAASDTLPDRVEITWNEIDYARGYYVLRSDSEESGFEQIGESSKTTFTDTPATGLAMGKVFYYRVVAWNNDVKFSDLSDADAGGTVLYAPTNITATTIHADRVDLKWDAAKSAEQYTIYRSTVVDGQYVAVGKTEDAACIFSDTTVTPGQTHFFKIASYHSVYGESELSDALSTGNSRLDPPLEVCATKLYPERVDISWDEALNAESYYVYRSNAVDGEYVAIGKTEDATCSFSDYSVTPGQTHYFKVASYHSGYGLSELSMAAVLGQSFLEPPMLNKASETFPNKIEISWDAANNAQKYYIYRSEKANGTYVQLGICEGLSFVDTLLLTQNTEYYYKVASYNKGYGSSGLSEKSIFVKGKLHLDPPQSVTTTSLGTGWNIVLHWDKNEFASSYVVYRSKEKAGEYHKLGETTTLSYTDASYTGLVYGPRYYYKVKSKEATYGESEFSKDNCFAFTKIESTTDVTATRGDYTDMVELEWEKVEGASSYMVFRSEDYASGYYFVEETPSDEPLFEDTTVDPGVSYYYKIVSCNDTSNVESELSSVTARGIAIDQHASKKSNILFSVIPSGSFDMGRSRIMSPSIA